MSGRIEYIARWHCSCGATAETEAYAVTESRGYGYMAYDVGALESDSPEGWLGGFQDYPPLCPACVEKKYA